jgi:hypothetical protein
VDGVRPIQAEFDLTAKRGWRNALRRVTVRHLTTRTGAGQASAVAGAVSAEAGQPVAPGEWLETALRELLPADLEVVGELVEAGA